MPPLKARKCKINTLIKGYDYDTKNIVLFIVFDITAPFNCLWDYFPAKRRCCYFTKKLNHLTLEAGDKTTEAAIVAGKVGIVGGGVIGGVIGLVPGLMSGSTAGLVICSAVGGVVGAGLLGLTAGILGGSVGYVSDLAIQNAPEYEFNVKIINDGRMITVIQHSGFIPVNSHVLILEKNGAFSIKRAR